MLFRRTKSTCADRKVKATASKAKEASTRGLRCCGDEVKVVPSLISAGRRYEQEAAVKCGAWQRGAQLPIPRHRGLGGSQRSEGKGWL